MSFLRAAGAVLVALLLSTQCHAQTLGTITGQVEDTSHAVVPSASVTVTNTGTDAVRTVQTNTDGIFVFPSLVPGVYSVKVEAAGFKSESRTNVEVQVQSTVKVDFTMEIGRVTDTIEVSASAAQLTTENATVGSVIENRRIVDLPLNGRDFLQMIALSANVVTGFSSNSGATARQGGARSNENFSIAGMRATANHYTLDGIENTDVDFNLYIVLPSIDAIQEFKIQSGIYPAEFGRELGQINVSTIPGTNAYHGTLFEFLRNNKTDALPYAFTSVQPINPPFKFNRYGFTLGGPLSIPKVFNAKNKLFFMTNFEAFNQRSLSNTYYNFPTATMRNGDLSAGLGVAGGVIYDPLNRTTDANGVVTATPIPGNIIPTSRIAPDSIGMLNYVPLPNQPSSGVASDYLASPSVPLDKAQFTLRMDYNESAGSSWFGRYSWTDEGQVSPTIGGAGATLETNAEQYVLSNTRVFSATKVNEARFGISRMYNGIGQILQGLPAGDIARKFGFPGLLSQANSATWGVPSLRQLGGGMSGWGDASNGPYILQDAIFQGNDNFSWIHGKHSFRFGGELRRDRYNQLGNEFARGAFSFTGVTAASPASPQLNLYTSWASYMLGYPSSVDGSVEMAFEQMRGTSGALYIDDTYRVSPKVTLSLGLRWELVQPFLDKSGHETNVQIPYFSEESGNVANMALHPVEVRSGTGSYYDGLPFFYPGLQVARDGRLSSRMYPGDPYNFAPRIGLAWNPSPKWSVRMGAGLFYVQDSGNSRFDLARAIGGRYTINANGTLPNLTWTNYLSSGSSLNINGPFLYGVSNNLRTPRVYQWLLDVQHQLTESTMFEASYTGSIGRRLEGLYNANEPLAGTSSIPSRLPFPEIGEAQVVYGDDKSNYNALSVRVQRRYSSGLTFQGAYTWSHSMDDASAIRGDTLVPQNARCISCEYAPSAFDVKERFVLSIVYDLPFGKGKKFVNMGGVANEVIGGWQIGSIYSVQTGIPGYPTPGSDQSNTGIGQGRDRLNATGVSTVMSSPGPNMWFNTAAYSLEPFGTFGSAGRNSFRQPGRNDVDLTMLKNFRIREGHALQFRYEVFNSLNHPNWSTANGTWGATFGRITSTGIPMRQMQFGLKYNF
jgi:hypothetical protein